MKHMYLDVSKDILNIERPKLFENVSVARVTYRSAIGSIPLNRCDNRKTSATIKRADLSMLFYVSGRSKIFT